MKLLQALLCLGLLLSSSNLTAEEKLAKEKLVGKWSPVKKADTVLDISKDGKLTVSLGEGKILNGTYEWTGDKLKVVIKLPEGDKVETLIIKALTDEKLITVEDKEKGKEDEFKRVK